MSLKLVYDHLDGFVTVIGTVHPELVLLQHHLHGPHVISVVINDQDPSSLLTPVFAVAQPIFSIDLFIVGLLGLVQPGVYWTSSHLRLPLPIFLL